MLPWFKVCKPKRHHKYNGNIVEICWANEIPEFQLTEELTVNVEKKNTVWNHPFEPEPKPSIYRMHGICLIGITTIRLASIICSNNKYTVWHWANGLDHDGRQACGQTDHCPLFYSLSLSISLPLSFICHWTLSIMRKTESRIHYADVVVLSAI